MKIINIPQGYSGILNIKPSGLDINGLYTHGFSTCNVVICISTSQIFLMHVGVNDTASLLSDIKKVKGELSKIHVLYRPQEQVAGILKSRILNLLVDNLDKGLSVEIQVTEAKEEIESVLIYLEDNGQISIKYDEKPDFLLRHPHELQLETVQKICQVIGVRSLKEKLKTHISDKITNIFDGVAWTKIPDNQFEVDDGTKLTMSEIKYVFAENSLEQIALRVNGLLKAIQNEILVSENIDIFDIALHIELYLNKYNYALVFKRDILAILDLSRVEPSTDEENTFAKGIRAIATKMGEDNVYGAIAEKVETYRKYGTPTHYKEYILKQYDMIASLYISREQYGTLRSYYDSCVIEATNKNKKAREHYQNKEYPEAANLFLDALKLLTYSCLKGDTKLNATTFSYNTALKLTADCSEVKNDIRECEEPEKQEVASSSTLKHNVRKSMT